MYSVVLLVALTGGEATPAFGKGCKGCSGCYGSCYGGCWGSCSGGSGCWGSSCYGSCSGRKHKHKRMKGCCGGGGLFSKRKRSKSCHGCSGGCYGSCYGSSCHGGYGSCYGSSCHGGSCFGYSGGCMGAPVGGCIGAPVGGCIGAPVHPVVPGPGPVKGKKTGIDAPAPATIIVNLPAEAKLTVDGNVTTSTSAQRVFVSPALERGAEYSYTLTAEVVRDGKTETRTERIAVRAGEETRVNITFPASVASK